MTDHMDPWRALFQAFPGGVGAGNCSGLGSLGFAIMNSATQLGGGRPAARKDFGPNQLAWIEKHLGVKSLIVEGRK